MIEFFLGAAGVLLTFGAFFAGIYVEKRYGKGEEKEVTFVDPQYEGKTEEEIQADRRKLIAEQNAFQAMQSYNPSIAYKTFKSEEDDLL